MMQLACNGGFGKDNRKHEGENRQVRDLSYVSVLDMIEATELFMFPYVVTLCLRKNKLD